MKITNLSKVYKTVYEDVSALQNVNLVLPDKGLVFIVGVSGSGKTTLMNMLSGVDKPTTGDVTIGDKSLYNVSKKESKKQMHGYRNSYVGLVFQDYNLIEDLNVYDNIKLPYELLGKDDFSRVDEVIKKVDIEDIKFSKVNEISSGQMQRVAIARALIKDSSMILADEPTGNLDSKNEKIVLDLLKEISKERLVIVITHGAEAAVEYGDRIIEIEDGSIQKDTKPISVDNSKTPEFIPPQISFSQQALFTKGFIKNNLGRSLSILLTLMLIPLIGGILSGFVFYNVSVGYKNYQDKYGSEYVTLSQPLGEHNLYYTAEQITEMNEKYKDSDITYLYDANINLNKYSLPVDYFFKPEISNILIYNNSFKLVGTEPIADNEIVVTDYVLESIKYYHSVENATELIIDNKRYYIVGVIETNYKDFQDIDFVQEKYYRMAFNENLKAYNAIYTSFLGHMSIMENLSMFKETIRYTVYSGKPIPETKYDEVSVYNVNTPRTLIYGNQVSTRGYGLISRALFERMEFTYEDIDANRRAISLSYSKAKYSLNVRVTGIYESDELGFIINDFDFDTFVGKHNYSRVLISKNDANYNKIINNENVTNESFVHADYMRNNARDSRIVMIEFLIVLIVIIVIFSNIINSLTINAEKKKIGIKYSFGLNRGSVVMPYILEILLYVVLSFTVTSVLVKWGFPFVMKTFIYTKEVDLMAFDFFYIGWSTIFGWSLLIYSIILISLGIMILKIIRKNPIEIIKDL